MPPDAYECDSLTPRGLSIPWHGQAPPDRIFAPVYDVAGLKRKGSLRFLPGQACSHGVLVVDAVFMFGGSLWEPGLLAKAA